MHDFNYHNQELYCEGVAISKIAEEVGTPLYIYSGRTLKNHADVYERAFQPIDHISCFAVKANSNLSVISLFAGKGMGADVVSGGEIFRALKAGVQRDKIVYAGVGKTGDEIRYALTTGILMFNCESSAELDLINSIAQDMGVQARIALRVNPDIDPKTHPYITTGLEMSKFGMGMETAYNEYVRASGMEGIDVIGMHTHIGSQITHIGPFKDSLERLNALVKKLKDIGIGIHYLDIGGGLGIRYKDEVPPSPEEWAQVLIGVAGHLGCTIISEPGRVLVGNAGILVTRVLYTKNTTAKRFIIVDAAMNDLIRPSLYQSYHDIWHVKDMDGRIERADIVGPICESGDFLAKDRAIVIPSPGDLLAVMSAGAYGFSMSSNYNSRPRVAEVMVRGNNYKVIRERETYSDLIRGET